MTALDDKKAAMAQVLSRNLPWSVQALAGIRLIEPGARVTGEQVRARLAEYGCPAPRHHNAWGALISLAVKRGMLVDSGMMAHMTGPKSNGRRTPVYVRAG